MDKPALVIHGVHTGYTNAGNGMQAYSINSETGEVLEAHFCSSENFAKSDLGFTDPLFQKWNSWDNTEHSTVGFNQRRMYKYRVLAPQGFILQWMGCLYDLDVEISDKYMLGIEKHINRLVHPNRVVKLHHPTGHPYWQKGEFKVELPSGDFYDLRPLYKVNVPGPYQDGCYTIRVKDTGIWFRECGAGSGFGKVQYEQYEDILLIDKKNYDRIEYVGTPLSMSQTLIDDLKDNGLQP